MKNFACIFITALVLALCHMAFAQTAVEALIKKSSEFELQNKNAEAAAELTKAIAIQPENGDLYMRRAGVYRFMDKNDSVAADALKAVSLSPDNKFILLTAANYLRNIGKCTESLNILNAYIFKNPASDDLFYARSHSQMCRGDFASAYEDMSKAAELNPQKPLYRTTQASLLARLGDSEQAAAQFKQIIQGLTEKLAQTKNEGEKVAVKRDLGQLYYTRSRVFHSRGDENAEFADLAKYIEYNPEPYIYRLRANIYRQHKLFSEAIADYTEAMRLAPTDALFVLERGDAFVELGKDDEAIKNYEQALKLDPTMKEIVEERIAAARSRHKSIK